MKFQPCRWPAVFVAIAILLAAAPGFSQYREYYVFGKVLDTQKAPLEGVEIILFEVETSLSFAEKTKKDGTFKFAGLPHGRYRVVFKKAGLAEKKDEWNFERPQDKMLKFEVPPVTLATADYLQQAERQKESAAGVKDAAEKVRQGDYDAAIVKLQAILDKAPGDSNALYLLGLSHLKKKEWAAGKFGVNSTTLRKGGRAAAHSFFLRCDSPSR